MMEKNYQPEMVEKKWSQRWQDLSLHHTNEHRHPAYCIMLPPPNVTGTLHMGHGFQHTLMDALIRRQRMLGANVLWQPGTDHAGIATQMVVERELAKEGKSRIDIGREAFIHRVWEWRDHSGSVITQQIQRMGASIDWQRARFSMDEHMNHATLVAFIKLYEEGLIYRAKRLVNWDPQLNTAVSDLEVINEPAKTKLWYFRYPIKGAQDYLTIATTRPETMLGDTAVAVHPDDTRYQRFIGQSIELPLSGRIIPIIADEHVDPTFGTGCVKITPAHDFNDYEMAKRHDLPMLNILDMHAHLNDNVPPDYRGLERFAARKKIVAELENQGLLVKIEDYTTNIPKGDRSGVIIEPLLTDQWFIATQSLAQPAIEAVTQGKIRFIPENWTKTYLQWLENIQDWCISRQLWWGHRIPIWYDDNNKAYTGLDEADARRRNQLSDDVPLRQETDVLDTWFTAGIYPFATLGWPETTTDFKTFYPTDVLVTGFDIIFFWVARMVMMGMKLAGDIPFKEVYVTGLIRDSHGQKMSKTKGNILDPIDLVDGIGLDELITKRTQGLINPAMAPSIATATRKEFPNGIEAHGVDALRFTFCALATTGRDINFDMGRINGYRNFCNKLWNAARYVLMNTEQDNLVSIAENKYSLSIADRWIQSALQKIIAKINQAFSQYRFDLVAQMLHQFSWDEYCDWYLELAKCTLTDNQASSEALCGTQYTLVSVFEQLLRLIHPIMPFISEEIWQKIAPKLGPQPASIMLASYPQNNPQLIDETAEQDVEWLKQIVNAIRNIRSEIGVAPSKQITVLLAQGSTQDKQRINDYQHHLKILAKIENLQWQTATQTTPINPSPNGETTGDTYATTLVDTLELRIPLAGLIDTSAELMRLTKEIAKLEKEHEKIGGRLNNADYVAKAPAPVVEKERHRFEQLNTALDKLKQQHTQMQHSTPG